MMPTRATFESSPNKRLSEVLSLSNTQIPLKAADANVNISPISTCNPIWDLGDLPIWEILKCIVAAPSKYSLRYGKISFLVSV